MARNPFKPPQMAKDPWAKKEFNDKNLNASVPLKLSSHLPSDRLASPAKLASPKLPALPQVVGPESPVTPEARKERFKRLAGILGGLKKS